MPAGADPVPNLPDLTPAQLLVKATTANVTTFSGHVTLHANLGLPDLGSLGVMDGTGLDLLSGSHTAAVWADGPQHARVELDAPGAENDWIRNGTDLWAWNSRDQSVTHATIPADTATEVPAHRPCRHPTSWRRNCWPRSTRARRSRCAPPRSSPAGRSTSSC